MDYHAIHGHDRASFDTSDTRQSHDASHGSMPKLTREVDRLPTVAASQVLDELQDHTSSLISTGLDNLDQALSGSASVDAQDSTHQGGIKRGQVTEIWGPPGSGRTALG
jgi:hypothetical protein